MLYISNVFRPREVKRSPNARVAECLIESIFLVPKTRLLRGGNWSQKSVDAMQSLRFVGFGKN